MQIKNSDTFRVIKYSIKNYLEGPILKSRAIQINAYTNLQYGVSALIHQESSK
jgi:hypothetical protein